MKLSKILLSAAINFFVCIHFCNAQQIKLVRKNYVFYNMGTGGGSGDWTHYFLVEGETEPRKAGYFGQHLKKYIQSDSVAVKYMNAYATHQTFKLATSISTITLVSAFAISNLSNDRTATEHMDEPAKNKGLLYMAAGAFAANVILQVVVPKSISKAVDSYNQQVENKDISLSGFSVNIQSIAGSKIVSAGIKLNL